MGYQGRYTITHLPRRAMESKKRAPSLWLTYNYTEPGDILVHEVFVPKEGLSTFTYYCCLGWNSGMEGGGYCGIQDHPKGRAFIFSLWDPQDGNATPITAPFLGPGTLTERFGGEGTGLKSMNFETGWMEDQWYTMVVRRWNAPSGGTCFGCWVHDKNRDIWHHLITMEYPVPKVFFSGTTYSFLEDWNFTSENARCVRYRNGFKRLISGSWVAFQKAHFQVNVENTATMNYDVTFSDPEEGVCIKSGGETKPSVKTACIFDHLQHYACPQKAPIQCVQLDVSEEKVTWMLAKSSAPQFWCRVLVERCMGVEEELYQKVTENTKSVSLLTELKDAKISVDLEDILGNKTRKEKRV